MITPMEFMKKVLEINPDDYIEITSVTYAPFYQKCYLALPDNWSYNDQYYNVPVEDLEKIVDHAIEKGYSVVWGGDVSNRDFSTSKTGYGIVPLKDWEDQTEEERKAKITEPVPEKTVTQELRQAWFDNYTSTDDHGMHIVGIAHDEKDNKYYLTKNSYGTDRKFDGYVYLSKSYMMLYMTAMMVNKNALPKDVKKKLGL
jgi:bleomycin hydrolase